MVPANAILDQIVTLLAADGTTIAPAALACKVHLAKAPFTPTPALLLAGVVEATFDGHTAKNAGIGPQTVFLDPITGHRVIQVLEPAGGWTWVSTGTTDLPQVIYGWYVTDNGVTVLYGAGLLPAPVTISGVGQAITLPWIRFNFLPGSPN